MKRKYVREIFKSQISEAELSDLISSVQNYRCAAAESAISPFDMNVKVYQSISDMGFNVALITGHAGMFKIYCYVSENFFNFIENLHTPGAKLNLNFTTHDDVAFDLLGWVRARLENLNY